jgi:serine/threonine-protein kinase
MIQAMASVSDETAPGRTVSGEGAAGETVASEPTHSAVDAEHHLLLQLGEGGTAQVFLAVRPSTDGVDKLVVLKILRLRYADNQDLRRMFIKEARFSARLNHANVVQTIAITQRSGLPAIVMEYLEGQSLAAIVSKAHDRIPLELHLRIIVDALRGLHYAHELTDLDGTPLNVVHRDISPQNIFVSYDGHVKLIDFGIAKLAGVSGDTATGVIKGKLRYMPPEQIRGQPLDRRVDVYAAGVLLWEAATRERMWKGLAEVAVMHDALNGNVPLPRDVNPDIPDELDRIIRKALSPDREARYATAAELESDLESFLGGRAPVTNRDVSKFVLQEFGELYAERKRAINQELQRRAIAAPPVAPPSVPDLLYSGELATHSPTPSKSPSPSTRLTSGAQPQPTGSNKHTTLVVAAVALTIGVVIWRSEAFRRATPAVSVSAAVSTAAPPRQEASPPASIPAAQPLAPSSSASATAVATASARAPEPAFGARRARPPAAPAPVAPAVPAPAPKASASKKDCDPPYAIDAEGTKRFKVECL